MSAQWLVFKEPAINLNSKTLSYGLLDCCHYNYTNQFDVHFSSFTRQDWFHSFINVLIVIVDCFKYCEYFCELSSDPRHFFVNVRLEIVIRINVVSIRCYRRKFQHDLLSLYNDWGYDSFKTYLYSLFRSIRNGRQDEVRIEKEVTI